MYGHVNQAELLPDHFCLRLAIYTHSVSRQAIDLFGSSGRLSTFIDVYRRGRVACHEIPILQSMLCAFCSTRLSMVDAEMLTVALWMLDGFRTTGEMK